MVNRKVKSGSIVNRKQNDRETFQGGDVEFARNNGRLCSGSLELATAPSRHKTL